MPDIKTPEIGLCTACDTPILDLSKKGKARFLPNYREHEMELSNESLIRVVVCDECKDVLVSDTPEAMAMATGIIERHKVWWSENLSEDDERMPKFHERLAVIDSNSNLLKFRQALAERNAEKELVREWQKEKADFVLAEKKRKERTPIFDADGKAIPVVIELPEELKDFEKFKESKK